jgi:hypothetical protein
MTVQNIYYLVFVLIFYWLFYKKEHTLSWLPFIYIILDSGFSYFATLSIVTYLRPVIFIILLLYFRKKIVLNSLNKPLYWFLLYTLVLVFLSPAMFYSIKGYMQVLISMIAFPLGYQYFKNVSRVCILSRSVLFLLVFSVIATAVGYIFDIGRSFDYDRKEEIESIGLLGSGGLYTSSFAIGILPFLNRFIVRKYERWILFSSSVIIYIFILLNLRRTAILMPLIGLFTYILLTPHKLRAVSGVILGIVIMLLLSPLYNNILSKRFEIREEKGRFQSDFYLTEGRYLENIEVFSNAISFNDPVKSLFGQLIYASGRGDRYGRMYHSDSASLLAGTGIVGMVLYIIFYYKLFRVGKYIGYSAINGKLLKSTYFSILLMSVFIALNGSITLVSIRTLIFLYLGAILSLSFHNIDPSHFKK